MPSSSTTATSTPARLGAIMTRARAALLAAAASVKTSTPTIDGPVQARSSSPETGAIDTRMADGG